MENIYKSIADNKELDAKLKYMWKTGAEPDEMVEAAKTAGIEISPDKVEGVLSRLQEKKAAAISAQELDNDELDQVAGGGTGISCSEADDCDMHFKDQKYWNDERCFYENSCDEESNCHYHLRGHVSCFWEDKD